ncbi:MAG: UDP-N-acetylglucosamine 2-epimerase (non-hydrolyzing) [Candidatus Omnitrophota bacterium]
MKKLKVITIFGTRPETIKLAPVIKELEKHPKQIISKVIATAQHRDMMDAFVRVFGLKADYDLDVMTHNQTLFDITMRTLNRIEDIFLKEKPDLILVQGDTTTAFVASLAAYYLKISVGHVEAGLRTKNKYSPFPEEMNRRLISPIADFNFAPTRQAKENLLKEGINPRNIFITGNTVIDALFLTLGKPYECSHKVLKKIDYKNKKVILVTVHRRESFGKPIEQIFKAVKEIANKFDVEIIYPVHLNPNVQKAASEILAGIKNIHLIEPLEYVPFVNLMSNAYLVLTDSGGVQEEAPSLGKPVIVLRDVTERMEGVKAGTAVLIGTDREKIIKTTSRLLTSNAAYQKMAKAQNPYGDGKAAERIVKSILNFKNSLFGE